MNEENRATLTGALWFFTTVALVALYIAAAVQGELTSGHVLLTGVLLALSVGGTTVILRMKDPEAVQDKEKRQRIDSMLRDMSDDDLLVLKQRLVADKYSEEPHYELSNEDGELVIRS